MDCRSRAAGLSCSTRIAAASRPAAARQSNVSISLLHGDIFKPDRNTFTKKQSIELKWCALRTASVLLNEASFSEAP